MYLYANFGRNGYSKWIYEDCESNEIDDQKEEALPAQRTSNPLKNVRSHDQAIPDDVPMPQAS